MRTPESNYDRFWTSQNDVNNNMDKLAVLREKLGSVKENENLAVHTTWRIGGPARYWFEAQTTDELLKARQLAKEIGLEYFILGGGSNVLFGDKGFNGLVIKNSTSLIRIIGVMGKIKREEKSSASVLVEADSGILFNRLVRFTLDEGLSGLEPFLGQPGTVGGAVYINAHSIKDKKFVGDFIAVVKLLDKEGQIKEVTKDYFNFDYDQSKIQVSQDLVLSVVFKLARGIKEEVWQKANEAAKYRQDTQPQGYPSAGCTFRNIAESEALIFSTPNQSCSAGFLIEQCGLKGAKIGEAQISDKHVNFILNRGKASAQDVLALIKLCKEKVKDKFGVELKEEIVLKGDF